MTYIPTFKRVCEVHKCPGYGQPLVDKGYGFPVCSTAKPADESIVFPKEWVAMNENYLGD